MEKDQAVIDDGGVPTGRNWDRRIALTVSLMASPPILVSLATFMTAHSAPDPFAWRWASAYVLIAVLAPLGFLLWEFLLGDVSDIDIPERRQRLVPQIFTVACMLTALVLLRLSPAPDRMSLVGGLFLLQAVVIFAITLRWKISVHCATAAGVGVIIWVLSGAALPLLLGAPAVIWSRLRLDRHTLGQALAGAALGIAIFGLLR